MPAMFGERQPIARERIVGTVILCAIGFGFMIFRHAKFGLGGDPDSTYKYNHVIPVDAHGFGAIAIGLFIVGLGIVNLALGVRDRRKIPVFWTGASLMILTAGYGIVTWVVDQVRWFVQ